MGGGHHGRRSPWGEVTMGGGHHGRRSPWEVTMGGGHHGGRSPWGEVTMGITEAASNDYDSIPAG